MIHIINDCSNELTILNNNIILYIIIAEKEQERGRLGEVVAVIHDLSEIVKSLPPFLPITLEEVNKKTFLLLLQRFKFWSSFKDFFFFNFFFKVCTMSFHNVLDNCYRDMIVREINDPPIFPKHSIPI